MAPFYKNLKSWRLHRRLTQAQVAERSGVSRPNLVALEQGRRECTLFTLQRLAFALEVTPGTLLDQEPPTGSQEELGRHEIDRIARSIITGKKDLPRHHLEIHDAAAHQAGQILRAAGIKAKGRINKRRNVVQDPKGVEQVLKRVVKLLPHYAKAASS